MLRRNVLIFHSAALGDFIVTWPMALALARLFPQSRIYYVTHAQKGALAERVLRIESADAEAGWHHLFSQEPRLPEPAAKLLANAHTVLSFVAAATDHWAQNVASLSPDVKLLCVNTAIPANFAGHVTDWLVEQWGAWPAGHAAAKQIMQSIASRGLPITGSKPHAIVLHPGAGSENKCWPAERFLDLAMRLANAGRTVRVLLGEVELERWPASQIASFEAACDVRRPKTYVDLLGELAEAAGYIGNDSGPGHLAGILGVPTISLFGEADPTRWKPLGPKVYVLTGAADQMTVGAVLERVGSVC
jgi:ADP-heptose:LPS heptosyltransferase